MKVAATQPRLKTVTETAALQVEARRLLAQYRGNPPALRDSAGAALAAGRNDATVAVFLKLRWAGRLSAALERYGAMLASADVQQLAFAAAGVQRYGAQLRNGLLLDGPSRLITISIHDQRLIAYDGGRVVVDAPVTTGRPALPTVKQAAAHDPSPIVRKQAAALARQLR